MTGPVDCVVIGAGAIGLAVARALALEGRQVMVLEREARIGMHTSGRNSGVIHAGIHYPPGSLKARTCVAGRELLYRYCGARGIGHRRCGKLIVAVSDQQIPALQALAANARSNGVGDLEWLDGAAAAALEPALDCRAALSSPSTGILDAQAYLLSLQADAESRGAQIACRTTVTALHPTAAGIDVHVNGDAGPALRARRVLNCAGLDAQRVARAISGFPADQVPRSHPAKGSYFALSAPAPFRRLIYPLPEPGGLGVHVTFDLAGRARCGPDVEWLDASEAPDYRVDAGRAARFYGAIRRYWPALADGRLLPDYAGIRPKLSGPGEAAADFRVCGPAEHGVDGIVNLFGIESPGLTASLALAAHVAALA